MGINFLTAFIFLAVRDRESRDGVLLRTGDFDLDSGRRRRILMGFLDPDLLPLLRDLDENRLKLRLRLLVDGDLDFE